MHQKIILIGHLKSTNTKLEYDFSKTPDKDLIFVQVTLRWFFFQEI